MKTLASLKAEQTSSFLRIETKLLVRIEEAEKSPETAQDLFGTSSMGFDDKTKILHKAKIVSLLSYAYSFELSSPL